MSELVDAGLVARLGARPEPEFLDLAAWYPADGSLVRALAQVRRCDSQAWDLVVADLEPLARLRADHLGRWSRDSQRIIEASSLVRGAEAAFVVGVIIFTLAWPVAIVLAATSQPGVGRAVLAGVMGLVGAGTGAIVLVRTADLRAAARAREVERAWHVLVGVILAEVGESRRGPGWPPTQALAPAAARHAALRRCDVGWA